MNAMKIPFDHLMAQPWVQKIGLTLLHSLWQGLLLAVLAGLILALTRKAESRLRYWLFVGLLGLFALGIGVTLYLQFDQKAVFPVTERQTLPNTSSATFSVSVSAKPLESYVTNGFALIAQYSSPLVLIWLLVLFLKSVQLVRSLYHLNYLQRKQTVSIGSHWENQVKILAGQLGIPRTIRVMQSALVKSPMILGHFKPVILVPLGILTAIPPEEIELMLLHELAHIKRLDFVVNLLQHLLELLFFFNPAILWISSLIRAEREACCDDLVVSYAGSKRNYIRALLSFREYELEESGYALAFAKKRGLLQRVERLVSQTNTTLDLPEKVVLSISVLLVATIGFLYAQPAEKSPKPAVGTEMKQNGFRPNRVEVNPLTRKKGDQSIKEIGPDLSKNETLKAGDRLKTGQLPNGFSPNHSQRFQDVRDHSNSLQRPAYRPDSLAGLTGLQPLQTALQPTLRDSLPELYHKPELKLNRLAYSPKPLSVKKSVTDQIIDEIVNAGLSPKREGLSFHITNDFLIVNGVKQSDEVHHQIVSRFVKKPGDLVDFTYRNTNP
ncbi:M56 family metallopeptidase [Larkinella rosea]|uniref:M56 family metallopeptidase n=1 Tax=Larkinella rosea TaxID=2025312 RepID=A0A3P1BSN9_9BACT|nr:M56 family metallopeptidase [Larkinella rosea]RRB04067.1 M56 family metallopeptidase [Larkinella rosea]